MPGRLLSVPFGEAATRALADVVRAAKAGDVLARVTVTVPSAAAGATLRRRLATDAGGLAGVTFTSLPQLAEQLAAPLRAADGRPPLPAAVSRAYLRAVLAVHAGLLQAVAASPATEEALEATISELADLDDAALDALATRGGTAEATVSLYRAWRHATAGYAVPGDTVALAARAVLDGAAPLAEVGPLVVHLPRRLHRSEVDLLAALVPRHPVSVLVGRTGEPKADGPGDSLLATLSPVLGTAELVGGAAEPATPTLLVRAPDPAEEVAVAVRAVIDALAGTDGAPPLRAERIAVVSRVRDPYVALVREGLAAAEVAHHAPPITTLAQSVAGRMLLGLLALPDGGFRRRDVFTWARSGPVYDPGTHQRVSVSWWDRLARGAGIAGGTATQWHQRLELAAEARRAWAQPRPAGVAVDDTEAMVDRTLEGYAELDAFMTRLVADLEPPPSPSWASWAAWADGLLREYAGGTTGIRRWPAEEEESSEVVVAALRGLAALDGIDQPPDLTRFRRALERELDRNGRRAGRFGHGVLVGRIVDVVGADFDLVVVTGAAEGQLPPRRRDDALVPERDREAAGGVLVGRGWSVAEEHRDLLAAVAAAPRSVLVTPRSDPRAQRERHPAPWFLDACTRRAGRRVTSTDVDGLRGEPWFVDVESFEWWLATGRPAATVREHDLALLLADHAARRSVAEGIAAGADAALALGLGAALARRAGAFDAWAGNVGRRDDLLDELSRPRSPTGLESYAACPFRYFLGAVLNVGALDDPTDVDTISARDQGTLVHEVLERFMADAGAKPPDEPWSPEERTRFLALAEEIGGRFQAEGKTGRQLLWDVQWAHLRHQLLRILDQDEELRRTYGTRPVDVELAFGLDPDGTSPVELDLGEGRLVRFKGLIDRVDQSPDGSSLVVLDYKTGRSSYYNAVEYDGSEGSDLTARGTKLQLPIYALAALAAHPEATKVEARYWFVTEDGTLRTKGGPFDEKAAARFTDVVTTVVDGIEAGCFPANPGDETWRSGQWLHSNCRFCDFDRVCPTTRGEQWLQIRKAPEVAAYVELAELQIDPDAPDDGEARS